jgi:hypothetical protein
MGGELLLVSRVLIAARSRAKVQDLAPGTQRNRSLFRDVHPADRIADQPPRTDGRLLVGRRFAACERIYEPAQHPDHHAPEHRYGQAQYH